METLRPTKIVCIHDPAIDWPNTEAIKKYVASRKWEDVEPYITSDAQNRPTIYHVRPLPRSIYDDYISGLEGNRAYAKAFEAGCIRVQNAYGDDGSMIPNLEMMVSPGDKLAQSALVDLFDPASRYEIGNYIEQLSFLHPRISRPYTVLPSSVHALTIRGFQGAAESPTNAQTESSENPSSETPASTENNLDGNAA